MIDKATKAPSLGTPVKIGGVVYTPKFSLLFETEADDMGVDLKRFIGGLRDSNTGTLSNYMKLWAAMVSHHFLPLHQDPPSARQWAAAIDEEEDPAAKLREVCDAVGSCLMAHMKSKMQASSAVRLQETTPVQGPAQPN